MFKRRKDYQKSFHGKDGPRSMARLWTGMLHPGGAHAIERKNVNYVTEASKFSSWSWCNENSKSLKSRNEGAEEMLVGKVGWTHLQNFSECNTGKFMHINRDWRTINAFLIFLFYLCYFENDESSS